VLELIAGQVGLSPPEFIRIYVGCGCIQLQVANVSDELNKCNLMALSTHTKAPDFTLKRKTPEGLEDVSLSAQLKDGPVVLLFFPLAFTSVCQDELCSVSAGIDAYASLKASVLAVSVDSPFAQEAFADKAGISIPLLSDFNREVAGAYDVLYEELLGFKGVAKRSAFVINMDGDIIFSWSSDDPKQLPPFEEIQKALQ